jgi:hypothetical protein
VVSYPHQLTSEAFDSPPFTIFARIHDFVYGPRNPSGIILAFPLD